MDLLLEVVGISVRDVDAAIAFFADPDGNGWSLQEIRRGS